MKRIKLVPADGGGEIEVMEPRAAFLISNGWREPGAAPAPKRQPKSNLKPSEEK